MSWSWTRLLARAPRPEPGPDDPPPPRYPRRAALGQAYVALSNRLLWLGERLLFPRLPRAPRRVGVWRVGQVGDLLAALPALEAIRAAHPEAELVLLSSPGPASAPGAKELLSAGGPADRLCLWSREELAAPGGRRRWRERIAELGLERVYVLPQELTGPLAEWRHLLALRWAGARGVRGARIHNAHGLGAAIARAHDRSRPWPRESERLRALCALPASPAPRGLELRESERRRAAERLRAALGQGGSAAWAGAGSAQDPLPTALLCLAPGSKLASKRWPEERFAELARRWCQRGGEVAVLGGAGERELGDRIAAIAGPRVANLCGQLGLRESAALLEQAAALLSNDSGPAHLAAAVGCPGVVLFAGTDRAGLWLPHGETLGALRAELACAPCYRPVCPYDNACLRRLDLARVEGELWTRARRLPQPQDPERPAPEPPAPLPSARPTAARAL
jgi:ADP-heptose:LPS heptosyltransferase